MTNDLFDTPDWRLLRYFSIIAEEASMRRAAERLFMTQPPLSRHMKRLEEMLGVLVPRGAVYYGATRRRHEVVFDEALRERTLELITAIYQSSITGRVVTLPVNPQEPWYKTGGLVSLAPHFYEKGASVENFSEVGAIPLGKDLDKGA